RSLRRSSVSPFGSVAPGSATATFAPAPKFHAPQTIWYGRSSPTSTEQSCSRSAFGCLSADRTWPTRNSSSPDVTPRCSMPFTSAVEIDSAAAICSVVASVRTYSRSHDIGTFTSELPQEAKVVVPERADAGDTATQLCGPLDAHAEREAGVLLGAPAD